MFNATDNGVSPAYKWPGGTGVLTIKGTFNSATVALKTAHLGEDPAELDNYATYADTDAGCFSSYKSYNFFLNLLILRK